MIITQQKSHEFSYVVNTAVIQFKDKQWNRLFLLEFCDQLIFQNSWWDSHNVWLISCLL